MSRSRPDGLIKLPDQRRERSRLEWRIGDSGDPAGLVEDFLADQGLPVRDLAGLPGPGARTGPEASLFVSAAAGAQLAGGPTGRPSPVPAVPDVAVEIGRAHV